VAYGVLRLLAPTIAEIFGIAVLPPVMADGLAGWVFCVLVTGATMLVGSLAMGWEPAGKPLHEESSGWLRSSQIEARDFGLGQQPAKGPWPAMLGIGVILAGVLLSFVVFW